MNRKDFELMAPVGSYESLHAAIDAGADAVYFGVEGLNMRAKSSANFTLDDLRSIAETCAEAGVKTYLTVNTIIYDDELEVCRRICRAAREAGISAVIASDIAAISIARSEGVEVHISTQCNISNIEAVRFYAQYADVVVLARELNMEQVRAIHDAIVADDIRGPHGGLVRLEMFCHGALCMAVSGKCYLSLHQMNSSANRGSCTQICRRGYRVTDLETSEELEVENKYIMSPKDLCTIHFLDRMVEAGVSVFKIEGRARGPEYVRVAVEAYSEALDAVCKGADAYTQERIGEWRASLGKIFNRGFWDGYYMGQRLGEWSAKYGSSATRVKHYVAKGVKWYSRLGVGEFLMEAGELCVGDEVVVTGPTTGALIFKVEDIRVDLKSVQKAVKGDAFSIPVPAKIRPADRLYRWEDTKLRMAMLKPEFIASIASLGPDFESLVGALSTEPEVSVRINSAKGVRAAGAFEPVPWCADGFYLPAREAFTFDAAMHQGLYYVQDASSMAMAAVAAHIVEAGGGAPLRWLDACAAPGGKTTAIASRLPAGSQLVANEYDRRRAAVLEENVAKWGNPDIACVCGDAVRFAGMRGVFDVVSADVPCSGEGMMRKDADAAAQWSSALVADCARTQWRIVEALWQALRPGGTFVYSTCTFNRTENEDIVERMARELGAEGVAVAALERPEILRGLSVSLPCYRFLPGRVRGEGLFLCVLRKPGMADAAPLRAPRMTGRRDAAAAAVDSWLDCDMAVTTASDGSVYALPRALSALVPEARGMHVAQMKGRDIVPGQAVALSTALREGAFVGVDVDYSVAMAYLRREAVTLGDAPRGIVLLRYCGRPLGFAKNLGNRANNMYPQAWRVMSTHVPDTPPCVVV